MVLVLVIAACTSVRTELHLRSFQLAVIVFSDHILYSVHC